MRVCNFGSLNLDYVYKVDHFVMPGETLSAKAQQVNPGGKGLNQSIALARAGVEVFHAGCIGLGGDKLKNTLVENGVNVDFLRDVDEIQGNAVIQVNNAGENCILLFGGSNQCISSEQIDETLSKFSEGDYLVLQNEINKLDEIIEKAYLRGIKIVLNPSPFVEELKALDFNKISWILINEVEGAQLTGETDPIKVLTAIRSKYEKLNVVLTLGENGAYCSTCDQQIYSPAIKTSVVDTTAAGDTFTGYFLASLLEGKSLEACMERASKAASISVSRPGAAESIPQL